jgi:hypothetical protein
MDGCEDCNKTIKTEKGEISVDMCQMLGTCTCNHNKNATKEAA